MRIILDTNIFIPLEDSSIQIDEHYSKLTQLASGIHQLLIHPESINDINRDQNTFRRESMLRRIGKYNLLQDPPVFNDGEEIKLFGKPSKENDSVDNLILLAILKNCAHILITEDTRLLSKAKTKGVGDSVLTVRDACSLINNQDVRVSAELVNIKDVYCHSLSIDTPIFDSLRQAYKAFNDWFERSAKDGRKAWICGHSDDIQALCIYKDEQNEIVTNENIALPGNLLKLCTLKVDRNGLKLGELLIKQAFDYADLNNKDYVYLTVDEINHKYLIDLIADFGFQRFGTDKKGRDTVYVKSFISSKSRDAIFNNATSPLEFLVNYYPAVDARNVDTFLVPIQPHFHGRLFPDLVIQPSIFPSLEDSVGNAIKQAYLCKSNTKSVEVGDLVFFYRTQDQKSITSYGVVERFLYKQNSETIYNLVKRRTVYTMDEIREMNRNFKTRAILFRRVRHLKQPIPFTRLIELGIVSGSIQSLVKLEKSSMRKLIHEAKLHDCFLSD